MMVFFYDLRKMISKKILTLLLLALPLSSTGETLCSDIFLKDLPERILLNVVDGAPIYYNKPHLIIDPNFVFKSDGINFGPDRYSAQLEAYKVALKGGKYWYKTAETQFDQRFLEQDNLIVIIPDAHTTTYSKLHLINFLKKLTWDWVGIEMFFANSQDQINIVTDPKSPRTLREENFSILSGHLNKYWEPYIKHGPTPNEKEVYVNMFRNLIDISIEKGTKVLALDAPVRGDNYATPYSLSYRNYMWTEALLSSNRGILIGGSAHFLGKFKGVQLQDYILSKFPHKKVILFDWARNKLLHFEVLNEKDRDSVNTNDLRDKDPAYGFGI